MELRDYQQSLIAQIYGNIRDGSKRVLVYAGTGAGKTVVATKIIKDALSKDRKCLFVVHRDVLVSQTSATFKRNGIHHGIIKGGSPEYRKANVQIASVQTLSRRDWWRDWGADVVVWDEAHINAFSTPCMTIGSSPIQLFLTASPFWLSRKKSGGCFADSIACSPMPKELIQAGYLSPLEYYGSTVMDLDGVKVQRGDYAVSELSTRVDVDLVYDSVFKDWQRLAGSRRTLAFCVSVAHANRVAKYWAKQGKRSAVVTGDTPHRPNGKAYDPSLPYRQDIYEALANHELDLVTSCDALSEGFDVPSIDCCILWRPTKSYALFLQQIGRGMRISEGKKNCIILDPSGNTIRHGFIEELERDRITLDPPPLASGKGEAPLKICPICSHLEHISRMTCSKCEAKFPETQKFVPVGGLVKLSPELDKFRLFYERQICLAYRKGYSPDFALMKFHERFEEWPQADLLKGALFKGERKQEKIMLVWLESVAANKQNNAKWVSSHGDGSKWVERWMKREFGQEYEIERESPNAA